MVSSVSPPTLARTGERVSTTALLPPLIQPWKYKAIKLKAWHLEATTTATVNGPDNPLTITENLRERGVAMKSPISLWIEVFRAKAKPRISRDLAASLPWDNHRVTL